jgi:hypothetical protein
MSILTIAARLILALTGISAVVPTTAQVGAIDQSFDPGVSTTGPNQFGSSVCAVAVQPDGKILVGGIFSAYQGLPRMGLVRVQANGTIDVTYTPPFGSSSMMGATSVRCIALDPLGRAVVGGRIYIPGLGTRHLVRLANDGTLDTAFIQNLGSGPSSDVLSIDIRGNGDILIGGAFTGVNGQSRIGVAELYDDGSLNVSSFGNEGFINSDSADNLPRIVKVRYASDGSTFVCGAFTHYVSFLGNQEVRGFAKINPDGTLALSHVLLLTRDDGGVEVYGSVSDFLVQTSGAAILCGAFDEVNGTGVNGMTVLDSSGIVDNSFMLDSNLVAHRVISDGGNGYVVMAVLLDGYTIAFCDSAGNQSASSIVAEANYDSGEHVFCDLCLDANNNVIVAGAFTVFESSPRHRIARMHGFYGPALWNCLNTQPYTLPANNSVVVQSDTASWHEWVVEQCMQLTIRTCDASGVEQFGEGLYTACPAYLDSMLAYTNVVPNSCGGEDRILDDLIPGTYWLPVDSITGPYSFTLYTVLCGPPDCLGVPGGPAQPGSPCDDGDGTTLNDTWNTGCVCMGEPDLNLDCAGVPDGNALPGTPCDDGIFFTAADSWTIDCVCAGMDCAGVQGGGALPGTPCDDQDPTTVNDQWTVDCSCGMVTEVSEREGLASEIRIVPNPCAEPAFDLVFNERVTQSLAIRLVDSAMRELRRETLQPSGGSNFRMDRSGIPAGSYFLEIWHPQGRSVHRLVLQ